jgi:NADPH2:quinone reductase
MKAVILKTFGDPATAFETGQTAEPEMKTHQVLIRVEAFGLNFADVLARKGLYPETPPRPCVIGYEVVGRVEAQGSGVEGDFIGKRVLALTRFGGYASMVTTDYRAIAPIGEDFPADKALALGTQATTAYVCLEESMRLYQGDRVLVHAAAGGVGIILCQLALNRGCEVFGTASKKEKLDFLSDLGVQHPINYRESDYFDQVKKLLGSKRLDATFNSLAGKSVKKDLKLLGSGGKLVIFGAASRVGESGGFFSSLKLLFGTGFYSPLSLIMRSKSIIGINILKLGDYKPEVVAKSMREVVHLAEQGVIDPVIHRSYEVKDIHQAHLDLENRNTIGKLAVYW